jgi:hypothetical protein
MNIIDFERYRRTRKRFPHKKDSANDNHVHKDSRRSYAFLETGELLISGARGQLVVVDSYKRCSCYDM